jgi:hypothetical protein
MLKNNPLYLVPIIFIIFHLFETTYADDNQFQVQQIKPNYPIEEFNAPNVKIHKADELKKKYISKEKIPSEAQMNGLLKDAKLELPLTWDNVEKSTLYVRVSHKTIEQVELLYPSLPKIALEKFYKNVQDKLNKSSE